MFKKKKKSLADPRPRRKLTCLPLTILPSPKTPKVTVFLGPLRDCKQTNEIYLFTQSMHLQTRNQRWILLPDFASSTVLKHQCLFACQKHTSIFALICCMNYICDIWQFSQLSDSVFNPKQDTYFILVGLFRKLNKVVY